jgi:hypothetical protein
MHGVLPIEECEQKSLQFFVMPSVDVLLLHPIGVIEPSVGLDVYDSQFLQRLRLLQGREGPWHKLVI